MRELGVQSIIQIDDVHSYPVPPDRLPVWWVAQVWKLGVRRRIGFQELLSQLYLSGTSPADLQPFFADLGRVFRSHIIAFHVQDALHHSGTMDFAFGIESAIFQRYGHLASENLWLQRGIGTLLEKGIVDEQGLATQWELDANRYFREFIRPIDIDHSLGLTVAADDSARTAVLTVNRNRHSGAYSPEEHRLALRLVPHLRNVYTMQRRMSWIKSMLGGFRAALDRLADGALLLDRRGNIVFANESALRMFAEHSSVVEHGRRLHATWQPDRKALQAMIERACGGQLSFNPETLMLHDAGANAATVVTASPIPPITAANWSEPAVVATVFLNRIKSQARPTAEALRRVFNLTAAEAELALWLNEGATLAEIAARSGKKMPTLRSQLRVLLAKTGSRRQAELMRVIGRLTVP